MRNNCDQIIFENPYPNQGRCLTSYVKQRVANYKMLTRLKGFLILVAQQRQEKRKLKPVL